jgi:predicted nucleic acid-binding protein
VKYLLDASALLPLVTRRGGRLIADVLRLDLITTDLAVYEACNSLWKLATLLKTMTLEDASDVGKVLTDVTARGVIQTVDFAHLDLSRTLSIAHRERLTFYDASYIVAAKSKEAVLVTGDEKMLKVAGKFVRALAYSRFEDGLIRRDKPKSSSKNLD